MTNFRDSQRSEKVMRAPSTPELLYDGECPLCLRWAEQWRRRRRPAVRLRPYQEVTAAYPELAARLPEAIHLIEPAGHVTRGVEAVLRAERAAGGTGWPLWLYEHCALCRRLMEAVYRIVAKHRPRRRA